MSVAVQCPPCPVCKGRDTRLKIDRAETLYFRCLDCNHVWMLFAKEVRDASAAPVSTVSVSQPDAED